MVLSPPHAHLLRLPALLLSLIYSPPCGTCLLRWLWWSILTARVSLWKMEIHSKDYTYLFKTRTDIILDGTHHRSKHFLLEVFTAQSHQYFNQRFAYFRQVKYWKEKKVSDVTAISIKKQGCWIWKTEKVTNGGRLSNSFYVDKYILWNEYLLLPLIFRLKDILVA